MALLIYRWQRQHKELAYAVLTNRPLLTGDTPFGLTLHHDEKIVKQPRLVVLRIANSGNAPIEAIDFEHPLVLTFRPCAVLSVDVTVTHPVELAPTVSSVGSTVTVEPCLLNAGDLIEIQSLLDGVPDEISATARAVGVQSVRREELPRDSWGKVWRLSVPDVILGFLLPLGCAALGAWILAVIGHWRALFVSIPLFVAAGVAFWWAVSLVRRNRRWLVIPPPRGH